jgi:protein SCO1/2
VAPAVAVSRFAPLVAILLAACRTPAAPPALGDLPPFSLTERSGQPVGSEQLRGRIWVANFIFTACPDVCPALTTQMGRLDSLLTPEERPVRVSFSVDPARDTPAVLQGYAQKHRVGPNWFFLTGERAEIAALLMNGFHVAFADDGPSEQPITHSDRFVLVDAALRVRGYYHGRIDEDMQRLVRDLRAVRREAALPDAAPPA